LTSEHPQVRKRGAGRVAEEVGDALICVPRFNAGSLSRLQKTPVKWPKRLQQREPLSHSWRIRPFSRLLQDAEGRIGENCIEKIPTGRVRVSVDTEP
jgi:hypothetical protein